MQARNLILAVDVDHVVHNSQTQGFKQARCVSLPRHLIQGGLAQAGQDPHVSVPGTHRRAGAVSEEIQAAQAHVTSPRIVERYRDVIHHVAVFALARGEFGLN